MKDGSTLVLNQIAHHGAYEGTEVVLWKDGAVVAVVSPVNAVEP
jgi:hypothetical protein